jgi:hypothetical protein
MVMVVLYRMLFNRLPWPSWSVALAPDFTIFMPVNHRTRSVYDDTEDHAGEGAAVPPLLNLAAALGRPGRGGPPAPAQEAQEEEEESEVGSISSRGTEADAEAAEVESVSSAVRAPTTRAPPGSRWMFGSSEGAGYSQIPDMEETKAGDASGQRARGDIEMG